MPKVSETPKWLKPFTFHGLSFNDENEEHVHGDCPFCGKENKFFVNSTTGLWDCKVCAQKGNPITFIRDFWEMCDKATKDYKALATDRGLLFSDTLMQWGACQSTLLDDWLIPGYGPDGKLNTLYRYGRDFKTRKKILLATSEMGQHMYGVQLFDPKCDTVYICEGSWNAMVLWEILKSTRVTEDGYVPTGNIDQSLISTSCVIGTPGANVFNQVWSPLFVGKKVVLCYDSDHPKEHNNRVIPSVGWTGAQRTAGLLAHAEEQPESIHVIQWGPEGYDPDLKHGYDVRDYFSSGNTIGERVKLLSGFLEKIVPIPEDWAPGRSAGTAARGGTSIEPLECTDWNTLLTAWRKAMKWPEAGTGLDHALVCMLASITSTKAVGDQLWMKIIGPASCGKSTLCEALSVAKKYVYPKSTIRGFHSGFSVSFGHDEEEDNSLIAQVRDKTLVTKDGDTLLQSPNLTQILSEARDVYDRTSRTHYRNRTSKDYEGVNMTWLLCGTSSLKSIDSSELGERFLDCVIMDTIDDDMEDDILDRVAEKADQALSLEATGDVETQYDPPLLHAMQLTGGYIEYLRTNAQTLLHQVTCGPEAKDQLKMLAKFVSYMRARPSLKQDEKSEREFSARLLSQLLRFGKCAAVVLNEKDVNTAILKRVTRVAQDTARGRTLEITHQLASRGEEGIEPQTIASLNSYSLEKTKALLRFLRNIGAAEWYEPSDNGKKTGTPRWRLTKRMRGIYSNVETFAQELD